MLHSWTKHNWAVIVYIFMYMNRLICHYFAWDFCTCVCTRSPPLTAPAYMPRSCQPLNKLRNVLSCYNCWNSVVKAYLCSSIFGRIINLWGCRGLSQGLCIWVGVRDFDYKTNLFVRFWTMRPAIVCVHWGRLVFPWIWSISPAFANLTDKTFDIFI